jgi:hypothetical protein
MDNHIVFRQAYNILCAIFLKQLISSYIAEIHFFGQHMQWLWYM